MGRPGSFAPYREKRGMLGTKHEFRGCKLHITETQAHHTTGYMPHIIQTKSPTISQTKGRTYHRLKAAHNPDKILHMAKTKTYK